MPCYAMLGSYFACLDSVFPPFCPVRCLCLPLLCGVTTVTFARVGGFFIGDCLQTSLVLAQRDILAGQRDNWVWQLWFSPVAHRLSHKHTHLTLLARCRRRALTPMATSDVERCTLASEDDTVNCLSMCYIPPSLSTHHGWLMMARATAAG